MCHISCIPEWNFVLVLSCTALLNVVADNLHSQLNWNYLTWINLHPELSYNGWIVNKQYAIFPEEKQENHRVWDNSRDKFCNTHQVLQFGFRIQSLFDTHRQMDHLKKQTPPSCYFVTAIPIFSLCIYVNLYYLWNDFIFGFELLFYCVKLLNIQFLWDS